jgi:hypothetical protein
MKDAICCAAGIRKWQSEPYLRRDKSPLSLDIQRGLNPGQPDQMGGDARHFGWQLFDEWHPRPKEPRAFAQSWSIAIAKSSNEPLN